MTLLAFLAVLPPSILAFLSLLRFVCQLHKVDFYNGIVRFLRTFTDFYCRPLRAILPSLGRIDPASLLAAYLLELAAFFLLFGIQAAGVLPIFQLMMWAALALLGMVLRVYFIALLLTVIFSWVRPQGSGAIAGLSNQLIAPLLAPIHKILPPMGGLDFSPILLFFLIYFLRAVWRNTAILTGMPMFLLFGA